MIASPTGASCYITSMMYGYIGEVIISELLNGEMLGEILGVYISYF